MAAIGNRMRSVGAALAARLQSLFSLPFPLTVVTLCGLSYVAWNTLYMPEFEFWAGLPARAFGYAREHSWAAIALGLFGLAALPLAWLSFRRRKARLMRAIREWVVAAVIIAFILGLRRVWPYDDSRSRVVVYGVLLFAAWNGVIEAGLSTLKIIASRR